MLSTPNPLNSGPFGEIPLGAMQASARIFNDWLTKHVQPLLPDQDVADMIRYGLPLPGVLIQFKIYIKPGCTEQVSTILFNGKSIASAKFSTTPIHGENGSITIRTSVTEISPQPSQVQTTQEQITKTSSEPPAAGIVSPYLDLFRKN